MRELKARDVFLVILTERAMQSKWVHDEIALAWSQKNSADVTRGKVIVPVLRERCKVPPLVALAQYVDFRPEVDQAKAFQDLLYAIRLGQTRPAPPVELGAPFDLGLLPPLERFVGRAGDVQRVLALLTGEAGTDGQIASVAAANGLGGIGKTALATEVVRRVMATTAFPDGIAVVICKGLTDPVEILRAVLARFSPDRRLPDDDTIPILADRAAPTARGQARAGGARQCGAGLAGARGHPAAACGRGGGAAHIAGGSWRAAPREASVRLEALPLDEALDVFAEYLGRGKALGSDPRGVVRRDDHRRVAGPPHTRGEACGGECGGARGGRSRPSRVELERNPRRALLLENSDEAVRFVLESSYDALLAGRATTLRRPSRLRHRRMSDARAALVLAGALRQWAPRASSRWKPRRSALWAQWWRCVWPMSRH